MRRLLIPVLGMLGVAALAAGLALGGPAHNSNDKNFEYAIGLWGDMPYSDIQATVGVPNLIADMNASDLEFTVNDGDLKQGSGTAGDAISQCTPELYQEALGFLNALEKPALFTPGDNDWTDCDRPKNGSVPSLQALDTERQLFFSTDRSLGKHTMELEVQATPLCKGSTGDTPCVENRRWTFRGVTYATFNVQGSCNNLCDVNPSLAEEQARTAADIQWLDDTFAEARAKHSAGVMLISQADPGFDNSISQGAPTRDPLTLAENDFLPSTDPAAGGSSTVPAPDGFQAWLSAVRDDTIDFERPVVYVHGDSHYLRIDKPLENASGQRLENFTRVETFGDHQENGTNDVNWLKVLVDAKSRDVFAFQPQIVPGNRVAVPAPDDGP